MNNALQCGHLIVLAVEISASCFISCFAQRKSNVLSSQHSIASIICLKLSGTGLVCYKLIDNVKVTRMGRCRTT